MTSVSVALSQFGAVDFDQWRVFDTCVRFGIPKGIAMLQEAMNSVEYPIKPMLAVDGIIGPETEDAWGRGQGHDNRAAWGRVMSKYTEIQLEAYRTTIQEDETQAVMMKGWEKRVVELTIEK